MSRKYIYLIRLNCLAWGMLGGGATMAQTPEIPLDLPGAMRAAIFTHPSVRSAGQSLLQAGEGVDAAKAGYRPQIKGGIESQSSSYRNSSYDSRNVYNAKLSVSQMLYDFGKVEGAVHKAESGVQASQAQVQVAADDVAKATAQAWIDAHLQQTLMQIAREQLNAVQSMAALVAKRAAKGATTRSDVEQANSRVQSARSQLLTAESEAQRASLALMHLTSRSTPVAIAGNIPAVLAEASLQGACRLGSDVDNSAVRLANARRDQAQADLEVARAQLKPTVSLEGNVSHALTNGSRLYGEYRNTAQIGINVSMSLYEGGGLQARERAAGYQLQAQDAAVQQARLEMQQNFADARAQVEGWMQREPALRTRVGAIRETRDLYQQQYLQLGTRSLLDLLNAEQEYQGARIDQAQGQHTQYRAAVQCLYSSGSLRSAFGLGDQRGPVMAAGRGDDR